MSSTVKPSASRAGQVLTDNKAPGALNAAQILRRNGYVNSVKDQKKPTSGNTNSTMMHLYTDDAPGLKVDPVVVMVLAVAFIASVVALHLLAKLAKYAMPSA